MFRNPTTDLIARHKAVRSFGPALLSAFAFEGSAAVKDLMAALDTIRSTYAADRTKKSFPFCSSPAHVTTASARITAISNPASAQL